MNEGNLSLPKRKSHRCVVSTLANRDIPVSNKKKWMLKYNKILYNIIQPALKDAKCNNHNVAKRGKQSKKDFSTRSRAAESSYRPLDSSINPQPRTFRSFKLSQFRGERQALPGPTDVWGGSSAQPLCGILDLTMQGTVIYKLSIMIIR